MINDPDFRRLWYVRYADDFLVGYVGTRKEAEALKLEMNNFLKTVELPMSEEKTLITHARPGKAKFLNDEINATNSDSKKTNGKRSINEILWFAVPNNVVNVWKAKVQRKGKIIHRSELQNVSDYEIIRT
jgi:hypothetical protein